MKGKIKKFFTMDVRDHRGFTLVELIVVIAILAILAGVGTAGYAGYIKSANKNADKTLVGNIIRAIETGVYSTAFELDETKTVEGISYPVGYIVVSPTGTVASTSTSTYNKNSDTACHFETLEVTYLVSSTDRQTTKNMGVTKTHLNTVYTTKTEKVTYCTEHSKVYTTTEAISGVYPESYQVEKNTMGYQSVTVKGYLNIPAGTLFVEDITTAYGHSTLDDSMCAYVAYGGVTAGGVTSNDVSSPLYQALVAAFGDLDNVKLTYDGWVSEEGIAYSTLYSSVESLLKEVKSTGSDLMGAVDNKIISNGLAALGVDIATYLTEDYDGDTDNMLIAFAEFIESKYTEEAWIEAWKATDKKGSLWALKIDTNGGKRDFQYAARKAYNAAFASYCEAKGVPTDYTAFITGYSEKYHSLLDIPCVVCSETLDDSYTITRENYSGTTLKQQFAGKGDDGTIFEQVQNYYREYVNSTACEENAKAFYDVMMTIAKTSGVATDTEGTGYSDMLSYYAAYANEMSTIYKNANTAINNGNIVIMVYVKNGEVECEVYPSAANPRKD